MSRFVGLHHAAKIEELHTAEAILSCCHHCFIVLSANGSVSAINASQTVMKIRGGNKGRRKNDK